MFASATSARLQEIGPRFTLKLRWLRKGLPAATTSDGQVPRGGDPEGPEGLDEIEVSRHEKKDEDEAMEEIGKVDEKVVNATQTGIPPLDEEQEYEWKWKVGRLSLTLKTGANALISQRWRYRDGHSFCEVCKSSRWIRRESIFTVGCLDFPDCIDTKCYSVDVISKAARTDGRFQSRDRAF